MFGFDCCGVWVVEFGSVWCFEFGLLFWSVGSVDVDDLGIVEVVIFFVLEEGEVLVIG